MTSPSRGRVLALAGVIVLCLVAGSEPRAPGDGAEYVAMAMNFAMLDGPSLGRRAIPTIERKLAESSPALAGWRIESSTTAASDSRRDFVHFWFYPLLAAPLLRLTELLALPLTAAFTILNILFLGVALAVALPRLGPWANLLIFAGPVLWWIDKPHTEVFTVSLLVIAFCLLRDKPWWSLVASGLAATQNPPIAAVFLLMVAASLLGNRALVVNRRFAAGAAAGLGLVALHPIYYYWRYGTPSLLLNGVTPGWPRAAEISAIVIDPAIGLLGNFPVFVLALAAACVLVAVRSPRSLVSAEMITAALAAGVFLVSCARTTNFHHGGTPSLSRYVLWLVPLGVPLFAAAAAHAGRAWTAIAAPAALVSAVACLFAFHPGVAESQREPTWAATWMWTRHPASFNPLAEVFAEINARREALVTPISTANCEKVLLSGSGQAQEVAWPMPCYPSLPPATCASAEHLCYANWTPDGYTFAPSPGRRTGTLAHNPYAWSLEMNAHVRAIFDGWGWNGFVPPRSEIASLRQGSDVSAMVIGSESRFGIVLYEFGEGPRLSFRFSQPMTGRLADPRTGEALRRLQVNEPPDAVWELELPKGHDVLILLMTSEHGA